MIKALLLVCSFIAAPEARLCDQRNATQVINVPEEFDNPVMCAMHGQAYLAETSLSPSAGEYLRIVCIRTINPTTAHGVTPCRKVGMTLAIARMVAADPGAYPVSRIASAALRKCPVYAP